MNKIRTCATNASGSRSSRWANSISSTLFSNCSCPAPGCRCRERRRARTVFFWGGWGVVVEMTI